MADLSDTIIALYRRHARSWVSARMTGAFAEVIWFDRLAAIIPRNSHILDLGCGAGVPIARHLLDAGYCVTGVDSAPAMLALFQQHCPEATAILADMLKLSLDQHFDAIIAWDSFFHLSPATQCAMFAIFSVHIHANGALMFTTGPAAGEAIGTLEGEALYHASLAPATYRALLHRHGFAVVAQTTEDPACGGRTVWLARRGA